MVRMVLAVTTGIIYVALFYLADLAGSYFSWWQVQPLVGYEDLFIAATGGVWIGFGVGAKYGK